MYWKIKRVTATIVSVTYEWMKTYERYFNQNVSTIEPNNAPSNVQAKTMYSYTFMHIDNM